VFEWVRAIHDAFNVQSTWTFTMMIATAFAFVFGVRGGTVAYIVDKADRKAEDRLSTLSTTALVAFAVIEEGRVGVAGSTGAVLKRTLMSIAKLADQPQPAEKTRD
jgi:hypothetical protein